MSLESEVQMVKVIGDKIGYVIHCLLLTYLKSSYVKKSLCFSLNSLRMSLIL